MQVWERLSDKFGYRDILHRQIILKSVCMQSRMLYVSMWALICLCTMYSIAFERQLSNDMGLKSLGLLGVFTLFNAITSDFFHSEGKTDCLIDALKSSRRWVAINGRAATIEHSGMPSGPLAWVLNWFIASTKSPSSISWRKKNFAYSLDCSSVR